MAVSSLNLMFHLLLLWIDTMQDMKRCGMGADNEHGSILVPRTRTRARVPADGMHCTLCCLSAIPRRGSNRRGTRPTKAMMHVVSRLVRPRRSDGNYMSPCSMHAPRLCRFLSYILSIQDTSEQNRRYDESLGIFDCRLRFIYLLNTYISYPFAFDLYPKLARFSSSTYCVCIWVQIVLHY